MRIVKGLDENILKEELERSEREVLIFSDLASGSLRYFKDLKDKMKKQALVRKLHDIEIRSKIVVSPREIEEYYAAHQNEFAAPEFSDRSLFKQFIALLREEGIISTNSDEKLEFNERIQQLSDDAKFILSKEIRHGILRVAPQVLTHPDPE